MRRNAVYEKTYFKNRPVLPPQERRAEDAETKEHEPFVSKEVVELPLPNNVVLKMTPLNYTIKRPSSSSERPLNIESSPSSEVSDDRREPSSAFAGGVQEQSRAIEVNVEVEDRRSSEMSLLGDRGLRAPCIRYSAGNLQEVNIPVPLMSSRRPSELPIARGQRWKSSFKNFLVRIRILVLFHHVFSVAVFALLLASLFLDKWRVLRVNRDALLILWRDQKVSRETITTSIAFTRSQGVFSECFVEPRSAVNGTDPFFTPGCHAMLAGLTVRAARLPNHIYILHFVMAQQFLGPIAFLLSASAMAVHFLAVFRSWSGNLPRIVTISLRTLSTVLCFIFLGCGFEIAAGFRRKNPAFPISWPKLIRDSTEVDMWQLGCIDWIAATAIQVVAACQDLAPSTPLLAPKRFVIQRRFSVASSRRVSTASARRYSTASVRFV